MGHPSMSGPSRHVLIVGGGVIGTACAYELQRDGWRVTIIDRGAFAGGSSAGNCGLVCPSHVLPLAEPGAVGMALRSLFRRNSPFIVRPRLDPALWSWMLQFAKHCNEADMIRAGHAIQALLEPSLIAYRELVERETLDCEWETKGLLFAYKDRAAFEAYEPVNKLMRDEFHCPAMKINGDELTLFDPALKDGLAGGWYYEEDAQLRPDRLMSALRKLLESRGATVRERCGLEGFHSHGGRAVAAITPQGELQADAFIVAAGAWTPWLKEHLGCAVPIQPGKGYSLTMPRPSVCPKHPIIFPETRVAVTPFQSGYRLGSTMEFAGYDETLRPERLGLLKQGAEPYLREPFCDPIEDRWYGWRPMTQDSLPIIDRSPKYENVWIAAGHNMLGVSMAPATGRLVAEMVEGRRPFLDASPYRVGRFARG
jgi:D-amino-acid dehydrogenase